MLKLWRISFSLDLCNFFFSYLRQTHFEKSFMDKMVQQMIENFAYLRTHFIQRETITNDT